MFIGHAAVALAVGEDLVEGRAQRRERVRVLREKLAADAVAAGQWVRVGPDLEGVARAVLRGRAGTVDTSMSSQPDFFSNRTRSRQ